MSSDSLQTSFEDQWNTLTIHGTFAVSLGSLSSS